MERETLHYHLSRCAPALAKKDFVPIFSCFQFKEGRVAAFNDSVAITAPVESDFVGAVPGKVFLDWLSKCTGQEVEMGLRGGKLQAKCGRAKITLGVYAEDDFIMEDPDLENEATYLATGQAFAKGLKSVLVSMGLDPANPWRLGITVLFSKQGIELLATNDMTIARAAVDVDEEGQEGLEALAKGIGGILLPPRFAELLVDMSKGDGLVGVYFAEGYALAKFESGATLWSRTSTAISVEKYDQILDNTVDKEGAEFARAALPISLGAAIDRAQVVLSAGSMTIATLAVENGALRIKGDSPAGQVDEEVELEGHPDCEVQAAISFLANGLPYATEISLVPGMCIYLSAPGYDYLVSIAA